MNKKGIKLEEITDMYNKGISPIQIAEHFDCNVSNITRRLKKAGIIHIKDYKSRRLPTRTNRHKLNEYFFENIDTEEKAYFLGLMFADGSVSRNQFYLKMKDEDIIVKFKEALECDYPIIYRENPWISYCLTVSSQKLCNFLINLGCVPNKTRIIRLPVLEKSLYRHFIRGFFDGDGCLQLQDKKYHCRFDLTSASKKFLEDLRPIINQHSKTNGSLNKERKYEVWHLNYNGYQVQQILDWLYKDATIYLNRKYIKYRLLSSP